MNVELTAPASSKEFYAIYLESLRIDDVLDFDLYVERGRDFVLFRSAAEPFTEKTRDTLLENNTTRLFVSRRDRRSYQHYLERNLPALALDPAIRESARAEMVYDTALFLVEELFSKPTLPDNVKRSQELVKSTVEFILGNQTAFTSLLEIMAFDYTTYTHSVNVCALSLALAAYVGINDRRKLEALGTGALLHDIGKTRIPEDVLNKKEPLTPDEMFLIKRHPKWGGDLARQSQLLDDDAYYPILQHHERENGSGYPGGLGGKSIHPYAKITAIADSFDAMTTNKTYRPAMDAFAALQNMFADRDAFDAELLTAFTRMLGPTDESESNSDPFLPA